MSRITFSLNPTPPFRLDLTAWALRRRPQNEIDFWDGETYRRVLVIRRKPVLVGVTQTGGVDAPRLEVTAIGSQSDTKNALVRALERLLGLRIDLTDFYELAAKQPRLHQLSTRFRGVKPPRFPTVWEGIVNGVACQQLSLTVGIILLNRLASACGLAFTGQNGVSYAFPRPEDLAGSVPETVRSLGFSRAKTRTLIELSREISEGRLDLESLADLKNDQAVSRLVELRGVGRWTAEYALLRGMGRLDLFPGDDIGARNNLEQWMRLRKPLDYDRVAHVLRKWKPFGGLVYFHLLLDRLAKAGYLQPNAGSCLPHTWVGEMENTSNSSHRGIEMIKLERVYDKRSSADGKHYLVERLWPRGIKKTSLHLDGWFKDAAPSTELRKWFSHDPEKWEEFRRRYFAELDRAPGAWEPILEAARKNRVTLLYSSHDTEHNNAVALKEYLEQNKSSRTARPAHASVSVDAQKRKSGAEPLRSSAGGRKLK